MCRGGLRGRRLCRNLSTTSTALKKQWLVDQGTTGACPPRVYGTSYMHLFCELSHITSGNSSTTSATVAIVFLVESCAGLDKIAISAGTDSVRWDSGVAVLKTSCCRSRNICSCKTISPLLPCIITFSVTTAFLASTRLRPVANTCNSCAHASSHNHRDMFRFKALVSAWTSTPTRLRSLTT